VFVLEKVSFFRPGFGSQKRLDRDGRITIIDGVSLAVAPGERIGILGPNGAGKTTLLRLLAGIFQPHEGIARVHPDTAAILDAGFGIEPWLSGRENAASRLVLSGTPKSEHSSLIADLEQFLELGPYFDEPTRTYSAGMLARLVFGLGTVRQHTALVVDEGFGTVDEQFQKRAWSRLEGVMGGNTTVVMASHNIDQIRAHCTRGLLLNRGRLLLDADIETTIGAYLG
jgi:ABC-type polysaccharide/polyol phosphate transport system ATPase subunit